MRALQHLLQLILSGVDLTIIELSMTSEGKRGFQQTKNQPEMQCNETKKTLTVKLTPPLLSLPAAHIVCSVV